jgi:uncharacterized membrane protein YfhO
MKASRALIETVASPQFAGDSMIVLEHAPPVAPRAPATPGSVNIAWKDSDTLVVTARTAAPGIILITDAYSRYWRATALPGAAQRSYQVMPADWALMAVPVTAGEHRFLLRYCPTVFPIGAWISVLGLICYLTACWIVLRPGGKPRAA